MLPACPDGEHWYASWWHARPWWLDEGDAYVRTVSRVCERCHRWQDVEQRIPVTSGTADAPA